MKGHDIAATTTLSFRDAVEGTTATLRAADGASVTTRIPAGVKDGQKIRLRGKGGPGSGGGPKGDLYIFVSVREHDLFERDGQTLFARTPVMMFTAALGGELIVPTIEGKATVKIPAGTQDSTNFRLRGKGMKILGEDRHGDLYVHAKVAVPTKLNAEQREKLEEFAKALGDQVSPMEESFLERAKRFFR